MYVYFILYITYVYIYIRGGAPTYISWFIDHSNFKFKPLLRLPALTSTTCLNIKTHCVLRDKCTCP